MKRDQCNDLLKDADIITETSFFGKKKYLPSQWVDEEQGEAEEEAAPRAAQVHLVGLCPGWHCSQKRRRRM